MKMRAVAFTLFSLLPVVPAWSQVLCDDVVVDLAEMLDVADESRIAAAAEALEALGATVRIRTSSDAGLFDSLEEAAEKSCPSWGEERVVFWVTNETREVIIQAGPVWEADFTGNDGKISLAEAESIVANFMVPGLKNGSPATAFIQGLRATTKELEPVLVQTKPKEVEPVAPVAPATPVVVTSRPAANEWSFATYFGLAVLLFVAIAGLFGWRQYTGNQSRRQGAIILGNQCRELLDGLNDIKTRVEAAFKAAETKLSFAKISPFKVRFAAALAAGDKINDEFNGHTDPADAGPGFGALEVLHTSLKKTKEDLDTVTTQLLAIEREFDELVATVEALPEQIEALKADYAALSTELEAAKEEKLQVKELFVALGEEADDLEKLPGHMAAQQHAEAFAIIDQVSHVLATVREALAALRRRRQTIREEHEALVAAFKGMPKRVDGVAEMFDDLETFNARHLLDSVSGNGTEAEERIDALEASLKEAKVAIDRFDDAAAEKVLVVARTAADETDELLGAIAALHRKLTNAKRDAVLRLEEAETSITRALEWLAKHDANPDPKYLTDLSEGKRLCETAKRHMDDRDHLAALNDAVRADELADEVLRLAIAEEEQAERERVRAEQQLRQARAAHEEARRYMRNHERDVSRDTIDQLPPVVDYSDDLSPSAKATIATELAKSVTEALEKAKTEVKTAEAKRQSSSGGVNVTRSWGTPSARPSAGITAGSTWRSASPFRSVTAHSVYTPAARSSGVTAKGKW